MKIHSKKDIYYYYRILFFSFIPLILHGIIKNGLLLQSETNSSLIIFKPLIFWGISFLLGIMSDLIILREKRINKYLIYLTIFYMTSSINTPIWLFILGNILLIIMLTLDKNVINKIALTSLLVVLGNYLLKCNNYGNLIETSGKYLFSFTDGIFLRQIGGIATGNFILVIILLIILLFNIFYKRNVSLWGLLTYIVFFIIIGIVKEPSVAFKALINSTALFQLVIIAPLNEYSPYNPKGEIAYGLLVGLIGSLLCFYVSNNVGMLIAIMILSPLKYFFQKNKLFF